jgi:hypothetical protein
MTTIPEFALARNPFGKLVLTDALGQEHIGVTPVRAFPLAAPEEGLSLVGADGHELVWVERFEQLAPGPRALILEELATLEFMPEIRRLKSVSTFSTPSTWEVETDRGDTQFVLKVEEDIRRLSGSALLIAGSQGIQYRVRDMRALDRHSRKLLERFL